MDFENETNFPAEISRTQLFYKDLLMAIVVLKATFQVQPDGAIIPDPEQLPLEEKDQETPYGMMDGEHAPIKENADLLILGQAYAPENRPVGRMPVEIRLGDFRNRLMVFGDRHWTRQFVLSRPQPFLSMPIVYDNAYGGDARHLDEIQAPYPPNPLGKGFVVLEEDVEGVPLPNIEDPDELIQNWKDQPTPGGFAPLPRFSSLRGLRGARVDLEQKQTTIEPLYFNSAHPKMMLPELPLGAEGEVQGMTREGVWRFKLPELYISVVVSLGGATSRFLMRPDTLCLMPDDKRFFLLLRHAFVYPFIPEQKRVTHLIKIDERGAGEFAAFKHNTLIEAAAQPDDPIQMIPVLENMDVLPFSYETLMNYYPLTEIIHGLPTCNVRAERM